ncbi:MAG: hypothetical protein GEU94_18700 [Micromonosporaceae bacterium]|nr:hypothetical protein [Micromonosporaceae bacterium]
MSTHDPGAGDGPPQGHGPSQRHGVPQSYGPGYGPPQGYAVRPPAPYAAPPPGYPAAPPPRPYDPVIGHDFASWADRVKGMLKRSWRPIFKILFFGYWLPSMALGLLVGVPAFWVYFEFLREVLDRAGEMESAEATQRFWALFGVLIPALLVVALVVSYLGAVANLAVMKVAVNDAAETPVAPMAAYRSMLRPALPAWGWVLLAGAVITFGVLACVLPGIYLYVALSLILPVMLFERRSGLSRSFSLMHSNFWPAAGRVVLVIAAISAVMFPVQMVFQILNMTLMPGLVSPQGFDADAFATFSVVMIVETIVLQLAALLGQMVLLVGLLATYAELRGRQEPRLTAAQLAAEANR